MRHRSEKQCLQCNCLFKLNYKLSKSQWERTMFCSRKCFGLKQKGMVSPLRSKIPVLVCPICRKNFWKSPSERRAVKSIPTCSYKCAFKLNRNRSFNWKPRVKINCKYCGKLFEKLLSKKKKILCSFKCFRAYFRRENSPAWRGGVSNFNALLRVTKKYRIWQKKALFLGNYTCKECEVYGENLHVDHIKPYAVILKENSIKDFWHAFRCKELWDFNNTRVLCEKCHKNTPTWGNKRHKGYSLQ